MFNNVGKLRRLCFPNFVVYLPLAKGTNLSVNYFTRLGVE